MKYKNMDNGTFTEKKDVCFSHGISVYKNKTIKRTIIFADILHHKMQTQCTHISK